MFKDTLALKIHNCDICITNIQNNTSCNSLRYKLRKKVKSITKNMSVHKPQQNHSNTVAI